MGAAHRVPDGDPTDQSRALAERVAEFEARTATPGAIRWSDAKLAEVAQWLYRGRLERRRLFPADLFAEPAWDILLDLFVENTAGKRVPSLDLCAAAMVPPATGLRWIATLREHDLLRRYRVPDDGRFQYVEITEKGYRLMREWLAGWMEAFEKRG